MTSSDLSSHVRAPPDKRLDTTPRIALATALMALAVSLLPDQPGYLRLAISIATGAVVYGIAIALLFPRVTEELGALAGRLRAVRR